MIHRLARWLETAGCLLQNLSVILRHAGDGPRLDIEALSPETATCDGCQAVCDPGEWRYLLAGAPMDAQPHSSCACCARQSPVARPTDSTDSA